MPRRKGDTASAEASSSTSASAVFVPPPPTPEQKRVRREDVSVVPSSPWLILSKAGDVVCDLPVVWRLCPDKSVGGWRSIFPYPEAVNFPHGKLSHSYKFQWFDEQGGAEDVTFADHRRVRQAERGMAGVENDIVEEGVGGVTTAIGDYYDFAFHTNNTTLGNLTYGSTFGVILLLVLLIRQIKRFFLPQFNNIGRRLGRSAHGPNWEAENGDRIVKFGEYVYRLIYHSSLSIYGVWYFWDKPWWDDSRGGARLIVEDHGFHTVEPGMAWYFLVQCAYNIDALLSLMELSFGVELVNPFAYSSALDFLEKEHVVDDRQRKREVFKMMAKSKRKQVLWTPLFEVKWKDTVRGDFREMLVHHLVTNALVFGSSFYRLMRAGSVVFLLHDLSDVPIDLSKLANFVKWKATTVVCFVFMVIMWVITRLYLFPNMIIRQAISCREGFLETWPYIDPATFVAGNPLFIIGTTALLFLHITWFMILLRIGWTLVTKGETHDYSEFKDGEESRKER